MVRVRTGSGLWLGLGQGLLPSPDTTMLCHFCCPHMVLRIRSLPGGRVKVKVRVKVRVRIRVRVRARARIWNKVRIRIKQGSGLAGGVAVGPQRA